MYLLAQSKLKLTTRLMKAIELLVKRGEQACCCAPSLFTDQSSLSCLEVSTSESWVQYFVDRALLQRNRVMFEQRFDERFAFGLAARHYAQQHQLTHAIVLFERTVAIEVQS